jgi:hypothetical protein
MQRLVLAVLILSVSVFPVLSAPQGASSEVLISEQVQGRAGEVLTDQQTSALRRAEAGRLLLEEGVEGLQGTLATAGAAPLTFDQETQVRSVYDAHVRALEDLLAAGGGNRATGDPELRDLQDQLLLAAVKFLNPAQRTALTGSLTAGDFADLNSDLPEDEDELREYLSDLRSPASGGGGFGGGGGGFDRGGRGGGGGLTIDGFNGGRMPNRDEIQEIRINENSFTAENSNQSRGQTEIITRGGTGRFNGDATFNFSDEALDALNAFAESRPFYQRRNFSANVSGPALQNRLTLTFSMRKNEGEDGDNLLANTPTGLRSDAISKPQGGYNYTTRATAQLAENHVLNTSLSFGSFRSENQGVGGEGLPEQGSIADRGSFNFQVKETAILSRTFNNEMRFRVGRNTNENIPLTLAPRIEVTGAFQSGGSTQDSENTRNNMGVRQPSDVHGRGLGPPDRFRRPLFDGKLVL